MAFVFRPRRPGQGPRGGEAIGVCFICLINVQGKRKREWPNISKKKKRKNTHNRLNQPGRYDDTICPVDFKTAGQITSDILHRVVVSPVHADVRMHILFDCCHSSSACELPFVYRPDADGNVNLVDVVRRGFGLMRATGDLFQGDFSMDKIREARALLGDARELWRSLKHRREGLWGEGGGEVDEHGLAPESFEEDWESEGKDVWMYSGCADDQTSADTSIDGLATGAMSWAFINTMRENPSQSYIDVGLCFVSIEILHAANIAFSHSPSLPSKKKKKKKKKNANIAGNSTRF